MQQDVTPVSIETPAAIREKMNCPKSKLVDFYLNEGYEIAPFRTRSRDAAKDEAASRRRAGFDAAYVVLLNGWFGIFIKAKEAKESSAAPAPEKVRIPLEFKNELGSFKGDSKQARAFARLLIEAARNAEFEADSEN